MARTLTPKDETVNEARNFTPQEELLNRIAAAAIRCASGIEAGDCADLASLAASEALKPEFDAIKDLDVYKGLLFENGFELGMRITHAVMSNAVHSQEAVRRALQISCDDQDDARRLAIDEAKLSA